ncbi:MAG: spore germination lipoprotein GerD [Tumebacillaceae bacterium]
MKRPWLIGSAILAITVAATTLGGCGSSSSQGASGGSQETEAKPQYNETKQMVLDILHTKDGLDTLKDIVRDPSFKHSLAINEADVSVAMQKALTDGSAHMSLTEQMKSPKFATALAKTFKKDNETVLKTLMKDPEYQEMMLTLLKSPDFTRTLYDLMKTPEYRKQTMAIMTEALQNPEFRVMFTDLVKEAIQSGTTPRTPSQAKAAGQEQGGGEGDQKKVEGDQKKKEEGGDEKKKEEGGESGGGEGGGGEGGGGGGGS